MTRTKNPRYEVHTHCYVSGPNARISGVKLVHSHEGGDAPHDHEHTGPGSYTIDKDEWFQATGLRGGGRKKFTAKPSGPQLPYNARAPMAFEVIIVGPPRDSGPGLAPVARLALACKARPRSVRKA